MVAYRRDLVLTICFNRAPGTIYAVSIAQYDFASCGDDGFVKFWDARHTSKPMLAMGAHTHW